MKSIVILLLLLKVTEGTFPWEFLNAFDKLKLDWMHYTAIQFDRESDFDIQLSASSYMYVFEDPDPNDPAQHNLKLVKWNLTEKIMENSECDETKGKFIKNPNLSFVIFDEGFNESVLDFKALPCMLPEQPYFYVLSVANGTYQLFEILVYSHTVLPIGRSIRSSSDPSEIEYTNTNVYKRRSDFKQTSVTCDGFGKDNKILFMSEVYQMFREDFNFDAILENDTLFGQELPNGTWIGSVGKLIAHEHDLAAKDYSLTNDRLNVTEGVAMYKVSTQVVYLKTSNAHGSITGLLNVLSTGFWMTILVFMFLFFILFVVTTKYSTTKPKIARSILDSGTLIIKAFLGQGFNEDVFIESHYELKKTFLLQLQLLSFIGAMVFWIYSGCLISFFTFIPGEPPINFISDFKDSPMTFYIYPNGMTQRQISKVLKESTLPKSIATDREIIDVMKDMANGVRGIGIITEGQSWRDKISISIPFDNFISFFMIYISHPESRSLGPMPV